MTQEEFKDYLYSKEYSYKQDGKWLIINHKGDVYIYNNNNLISLPEYISFQNHGNVSISYNDNLISLPEYISFQNQNNVYISYNDNLESLPENIIFQNQGHVYISNNNNLKSLPENIIFQNQSKVFISDNNNLISLPENISFQNQGNVRISDNNNLKSLPKNIFFGENVKEIYLHKNLQLKLNYYGNYFSKITNFQFNIFNHLSNKLIVEKICINLQEFENNTYQTPHICLTKVLQNNENKEFINIKLPHNFLSLSSWI